MSTNKFPLNDFRLLFVFFLSGAVALIYQIVWQRMLAGILGADTVSVALVISSFMLGLGIGNWLGGILADRCTPTWAIRCFGIAECCIALFAFLSPALFTRIAQSQLIELKALSYCVLLFPTLLMGLSLPLLSRGLASSQTVSAITIGKLYTLNTFGAALGAVLMIPLPAIGGFKMLLHFAGTVSFVSGLAAIFFARVKKGDRVSDSSPTLTRAASSDNQREFFLWFFVYGLSGFIVMSYEIFWFRKLGVILKADTYTLPLLLSHLLLYLALGTKVSTDLVSKTRSPKALALVVLTAMVVYSQTLLTITPYLIQLLASSPSFAQHLQLGELTTKSGAVLPLLYIVIPAILLGPPAFLSGFAFPLLQKLVQQDFSKLGKYVGGMQLANIVGATLGPLVTIFYLLPHYGFVVGFSLISVMGLLFSGSLWLLTQQKLVSGLLSIAIVLGLLGLPRHEQFWNSLHGWKDHHSIIAEDGSGVFLLKLAVSPQEKTKAYVNGKYHSWLPYSGIHTALGLIPSLLHQAPRSILIIGLGSGDTTFAAGARVETEKITSVEIISAQHQALKQLSQLSQYPALSTLLADSRVRFLVGDGRQYLLQSDETFDIIESDALQPRTAYAGYLYSLEYFELIRAKLAPGGFAVTWAPTRRTQRTFCNVFPHIKSFYNGSLLIGSVQPFAVSNEDLYERLHSDRVEKYFLDSAVDVREIQNVLSDTEIKDGCPSSPSGDVNLDWFPRDELGVVE